MEGKRNSGGLIGGIVGGEKEFGGPFWGYSWKGKEIRGGLFGGIVGREKGFEEEKAGGGKGDF